jgi:hypothetical protein
LGTIFLLFPSYPNPLYHQHIQTQQQGHHLFFQVVLHLHPITINHIRHKILPEINSDSLTHHHTIQQQRYIQIPQLQLLPQLEANRHEFGEVQIIQQQ